MPDLFNVMATRRSSRRFSTKPVEMDKILQVVQAGALAPSSGNIQNWKFIIVTDVEKIRSMFEMTLQQEPFLTATAAVIVVGDIHHAHSMYGLRGSRLYTVQNCAAAIENMLLASSALGLGSVWVGAFDEDKIAEEFDIPTKKHRPQAVVLFGYPGDFPEPKEQKPLEDVVFFNEWDNRVLKPHLVFYDWATEWKQQAQKLKQHVKHVHEQAKQKISEHKKEEKEGPSRLEQARERMRDVIGSLKKEEYRR